MPPQIPKGVARYRPSGVIIDYSIFRVFLPIQTATYEFLVKNLIVIHKSVVSLCPQLTMSQAPDKNGCWLRVGCAVKTTRMKEPFERSLRSSAF